VPARLEQEPCVLNESSILIELVDNEPSILIEPFILIVYSQEIVSTTHVSTAKVSAMPQKSILF